MVHNVAAPVYDSFIYASVPCCCSVVLQAVGDAVSDLLMVEAILIHKKVYTTLASLQGQTNVNV